MEEQFYKKIVERYLNKKLSDDELEVFYQLLRDDKLDKYLSDAMNRDIEHIQKTEIPIKKINSKPHQFIYKAAAVLLLPLFTFLGYQYLKSKNKALPGVTTQTDAIKPAINKAVLILSDGRKISLDSSTSTVLKDGHISIRRNSEGLIVYEGATSKTESAKVLGYNTIQTPKGGVYQVVLPDNSKVWLNNASSIKFPVQFSRAERKVEITGEAYFEVVSNKRKPFKVQSNGQEVEVLGTHFNINAYQDEPEIKTTLFEGSVRVKAGNNTRMLQPGLQSSIGRQNEIKISSVDLQSVISWKEGFFEFDKIDIQVFMRQIARWYDIEIEYRGEIPKDQFVGKIKRSADINAVLKILEHGKVRFQLKGRKLIIG